MGESAELLLRMLAALAVVGAMLWLLARTARTRGFGTSAQHLIEVLSQRGLSRNASVVLVRVGERHLLLGVGDGGVRVLSEGDDLATTVEPEPEPSTSAKDLVDWLRERTTRKGG